MTSGGGITYEENYMGVLVYKTKDFDLQQIADSGQCFRLEYREDRDLFVAISGNHYVEIQYKDSINAYLFKWIDKRIFDRIWKPYFDLDTDYIKFQQKMKKDSFLEDAIKTGGGIRILRQDIWETVVTFMISQNNNIPRIRKSVNALCEAYGRPIGLGSNMEKCYGFPSPESLRGKDLSIASLGYREEYVRLLAEMDSSFWDSLCCMSDEDAKKALLGIKGIGEKVANCIMLFGLHRMNSYPRDVWINRMIDDVYAGNFDVSPYKGFAGYVQQLQFYHYRRSKKEGKV